MQVVRGSVDPNNAVASFFDTIGNDPQYWLIPPENHPAVSKTWVRAVGRKEGRAASCSCWQKDVAWEVGGYFLTSAALAVVVLDILSGKIKERGVMTAENAFEPKPFLDEIESVLPNSSANSKLFEERFEWLE
jgi:hypothetical protein